MYFLLNNKMFHLKNFFKYISKPISINSMNFKTFQLVGNDRLNFEECFLHENNLLKINLKKRF